MTCIETTCAGMPLEVIDVGMMAYREALALQQQAVVARKSGAMGDMLLLCEHPHVITLGRNGRREHLLANEGVLEEMGVAFQATDRGGDITYHGPGQVIGYPILDLAGIRRDAGCYARQLEETMIRTAATFGVAAIRESGKTGVWAGAPGSVEKLGAIGVHLSRWVTSHGFAFNVSTDLRYFDLIVPCGIAGRRATSLEKLLGREVTMNEARQAVVEAFSEVFGFALTPVSRQDFYRQLESAGARVIELVPAGV
jgi:lipoyl(octanoyl) transferase